MQKCKNQNGITLIALIITIIVMLILVGVTVTVALNGGLFSTAKGASKATNAEKDREQTLASGKIEVDGKKYNSMEDYLNNNPLPYFKTDIEKDLPETVTLIDYENLAEETTEEIKTAVDEGKIQAVLKETIQGTDTIAVIPTGFEVSTEDGENTISGGLVIKDGANEFVWIPCADEYEEDYLGPLNNIHSTTTFAYDSQEELNYYYGTNEDGSPYYNYADFNYVADKANIETSINKYDGFYVGRYETTIDENGTIGSMRNTEVLTSEHILKNGTNTTSNDEFHYRWYGLYKAQKDMYSENEEVFSTMITSKEWDTIMSFTGYGNATRSTTTYSAFPRMTVPELSGSAYKNTTDTYDVSKNIFDLAGNVCEDTYPINDGSFVRSRGSHFGSNSKASGNGIGNKYTASIKSGSRTALYIR